jgi:PRC-barrel domain
MRIARRTFLIGLALVSASGARVAAQAPHDMPVETPMPSAAEARMARRWPQPVRVGDLIGLPVLDDGNATLGHVRAVVRSPQGKIRLIVCYGGPLGGWLNWGGRPVAVPLESAGIFGRQIAAVDMSPKDFAAAPTWMPGPDEPVAPGEMIRIALTRR